MDNPGSIEFHKKMGWIGVLDEKGEPISWKETNSDGKEDKYELWEKKAI